MNLISKLFGLGCLLSLTSCLSTLRTPAVFYQAVRLDQPKIEAEAESAEIVVSYSITPEGDLSAIVINPNDEILVIDQTKSFFINSNGLSTSYYDPTVRTETVTGMTSGTRGMNVNLGSVAGALGIGGWLGTLLNGVNVGGSNTNGQAVSNTTYFADQPQISLGPHGHGAMSKVFKIHGIGTNRQVSIAKQQFSTDVKASSPVSFSVCITYSTDNGKTFKSLTSNMFVNSQITEPVSNGKYLNQSLRYIFTKKNDAVYEPWWMIHVVNNVTKSNKFWGGRKEAIINDSYSSGLIIDFQ